MNISFRCLESRIDTNDTLYGKFSITSIPSGQGNTFANALRRSLFSDLSGLAITHFCITSNPKLDYEFATLPGLTESLLDFSLNLKKIVLTGRLVDNFPESLSYYEKPVSKPSENICVIKNNNVLTKSFLKSFKILRSKSLNVKQKQTAGFSPAYPFSISYIPYVCPSLKEKDRKATPKQDVSPPEKRLLSCPFPFPPPSHPLSHPLFPVGMGKGIGKGALNTKERESLYEVSEASTGLLPFTFGAPFPMLSFLPFLSEGRTGRTGSTLPVLPVLPSDRKDRKDRKDAGRKGDGERGCYPSDASAVLSFLSEGRIGRTQEISTHPSFLIKKSNYLSEGRTGVGRISSLASTPESSFEKIQYNLSRAKVAKKKDYPSFSFGTQRRKNNKLTKQFLESSALSQPFDSDKSKGSGSLPIVYEKGKGLSLAPIGFLKMKGPATLRASDLILPPGIRCVHPNQYLGTLAADGALSIKFLIATGKGYVIQDETFYDSLSRGNLSPRFQTQKNKFLGVEAQNKFTVENSTALSSSWTQSHTSKMSYKGHYFNSPKVSLYFRKKNKHTTLSLKPFPSPGVLPFYSLYPVRSSCFATPSRVSFITLPHPLRLSCPKEGRWTLRRWGTKGERKGMRPSPFPCGDGKGVSNPVLRDPFAKQEKEHTLCPFPSPSVLTSCTPKVCTLSLASQPLFPAGMGKCAHLRCARSQQSQGKGMGKRKGDAHPSWEKEGGYQVNKKPPSVRQESNNGGKLAIILWGQKGSIATKFKFNNLIFNIMRGEQRTHLSTVEGKDVGNQQASVCCNLEKKHFFIKKNLSKKLVKKQFIWSGEQNFYPVLPLDATFTPITKANFQIDVNRDKEKNQETIIFEVWTNGSITPKRAIQESSLILAQDFYSLFCSLNELSNFELWWKRESLQLINTSLASFNNVK